MARPLRPILLTALLALAAWIFARAPLPTVSAQSQVVGSGPNRAGLVIRFDDGRVEKRCVAFSEQDISGLELLQRSGLSDVITDQAGAVCGIGGKGCPSDDCFCQCPFPNCEYWAYYHRQNGAWVYAQDGQVYAQIVDGSLDGWSWGQGDFQQGVEPPQVDFDQVCPAASTNATSTATPTQSAGSGNPPQVTFSIAAYSVTAGQCTTLTWQTTDASSVTLEGTSVPFQGSQQVCPNATQSWTLVATNAAGQTSRQLTVAVQSANPGEAAPTAPPTASPTRVAAGTPTVIPTVGAPRLGSPTPSLRTPRPIITQAPQPLPNATVSDVLPPPTLDLQGGGVPLAPTSEPLPVMPPTPALTPTRFEFGLPPTATPRPRRVLNPDDPTPTPLLVARVDIKPSGGSASAVSAASQSASARATGSTQSVQSRSFTPDLLPGYAAYIASLAVLLIMGWYVLRRRHGQVPVHKDE